MIDKRKTDKISRKYKSMLYKSLNIYDDFSNFGTKIYMKYNLIAYMEDGIENILDMNFFENHKQNRKITLTVVHEKYEEVLSFYKELSDPKNLINSEITGIQIFRNYIENIINEINSLYSDLTIPNKKKETLTCFFFCKAIFFSAKSIIKFR